LAKFTIKEETVYTGAINGDVENRGHIMKLLSQSFRIIAGTALLLIPTVGLSLTSFLTDRYEYSAQICSLGDTEDCFETVLPLLADMRTHTIGDQYDFEIGTYAIAFIDELDGLSSPSKAICILFADVLEEIALSTVDRNQAEQISTVADVVRSCDFGGFNVDRLLASP
jgi:hypothetical protein